MLYRSETLDSFHKRNPNGIGLLDYGYVKLVDYMGNDTSIVNSARISYHNTKKKSDDERLIHRLMKDGHTSPFESCEIQFNIKLPIFVARQLIRHRTANLNEMSARYSVLPSEFYIPAKEQLTHQSSVNKQGKDGVVLDNSDEITNLIWHHSTLSYELYEKLLGFGLTRELSRMVLPLNIYTEWYWKIDLHNLFKLLKLRLDPHAQWETRQYAKVIAKYVKLWCPVSYAAFELYYLNQIDEADKP
jgi:thymidylate synthase (FAD)